MSLVKKTLAVVMAAIMAMTMLVSAAFAEDVVTSITAPSNGHTYEVYQIFTGDLSTNEDGDTVLTNVKWGSNGTGTAGDAVSEETLAGITSANATSLANIKGTPAYTVAAGQTVSVTPGYYLIKDVDGTYQDKDDAYTKYIVKVAGQVTISPKTGTPTVQKKVQDVNDTTGTTTGWQDSADFDINDTINYQLTATMGDLTNYDHYYVEFVDTMTHLTYTGIKSVKVGETTLTTDQYTASWDAGTKQLNVSIVDVKAYGATTGTKVVVEYTATLDADAVVGSTGNPNEVYLVYSNNPNNTGNGTTKPDETGKTPKDKNIVFTYTVSANKVTADKTPLAGATFELFKKVNGEWKSLGTVEATKADGSNTYTSSWKGVDDGDYKLVETVAPTGYNKIADVEFTISASHSEEADDPQLLTLEGGDLFTGSVDTGTLTADIVNKKGATLPETGGMGTTILYVVGGALVLGAGVLLVTKRRMASER